MGAGNQGALADAPGSGNEHKIISFGHALKEYPGFEIAGYVDKDSERSIKAIEAWGGTSFCCIQHAIEDFEIDVAIMSTPDDTHYEALKELAEYPLKLVICEKPLCTDLQQAREIVELYKAKGVPILVNYTRRFLPYYDELKTRKPIFGICNFNRGWIHSATHGIDFFNMLGLKDYKLIESKCESRVWTLAVTFEGYGMWHEQRIGEQPVWPYYDKSHWHLVDNAYRFLEGREPLKCTGEDALRTLEICFELMEGR